MRKFRIIQNFYEKKKDFHIQRKKFFGWETTDSNVEVFDGIKLNYKNFETYEQAENYFFQKYCSSCSCEISGNIYYVYYIDFSF
jgi:hypothetical protein